MENGEGKAFQRALSDFMYDFASGDAIRHLADQGYTVSEIAAKLSFPTPKDRIADVVWKHYLDKGVILLEEPESGQTLKRVRYVTEQGAYGRVSMRQVVEEIPMSDAQYLPCDFGKRLWRDRQGFQDVIKALPERDRQYLLELPWPLQTVWHVRDERMDRIHKNSFEQHLHLW